MEGCAIGPCANVCSEAAKGIFQEIKRHMRYVFVYKKNVDKFEGKMKSLIAKRQSVQLEVETAERNVEKIKPEVKLWCDRVDKAINEDVKTVKDLEDKAKNKCFFDLRPNIKSRYQLSKKAEEGAAAVDELLQQGGFDKVGYRDVPEAPEAPKNFRAFDSRKEIFDRVIEALKDSTTSMIGVYGTGGVGKTTLVNEVARRVQEDNLFGWVAKATVTRTPNIEKIQDEIAESLKLELKEKSIQERARLLLARLKQEKKKILIVLDDIWARLDLEQVGIPSEDQQEGCKILLTSRNQNVLTNEMDAKKTFVMDVLEEKEAWELFKKMAENDFENRNPFRSVATEVAKKCEGLPVSIVTVARALRNKDIHAWKDASLKFQRPSPSNFTGIPRAVYSAIELSYNNLESGELKQAFLLCGVLGHNARVEDLVRYGMGLRLFDNVKTVEDTRNRVLTLVSDLKAFCLLRDSYSHERFDLHDFDCDVALAIASRDNHAFALKHNGVFDDWPDEERMRKFKMLSLSFDSVEKFPHELECPQLDFFCMGSNDSGVEMPINFFQKMENLKVLDLIKMKFSSISLPTSLRTLCLNQCVLGDMVNLGKLKNLEILNLSGSDIEMLPKETGQLTKLRLLDVSDCYNLKIPAGVLSNLSKLEELYMGRSFERWNQGSDARLDELRDLPYLTTLSARIPDAKIVPYDLFSLFAEKLERYRIFIGNDLYWHGEIEFPRAVKLILNTNINQLDDGLQCLLMKSTAFYLEGLQGAKIVFSKVGNREGLLHLKHIHIRFASEIQYIMKDNDAIDKIEFQQLRSLKLRRLPELISFCSKNRSGGSTSTPQHDLALFGEEMKFPSLEKLELASLNVERIWPNQFSIISDYPQNLTNLTVEDCHNLKHILSFSVSRSLTHLKSFVINRCNGLKEIIFTEDIKEDMMSQVFPKLELLEFQYLPNLTRLCHGSNFEFPLLKELFIRDCLTYKTFISKSTLTNEIPIIQEVEENNAEINVPHLFNEKMKFPCLEKLQVDSLNVERIWSNQFSIISDYSQNLTSLSIQNCHNLKHILSFSVSRTLAHLKSFEIKGCKCLKEIISTEDIEEDMMSQAFLKLELLGLRDLPNLTRFCHGSKFEFPLLKELIIGDCPAFEAFFSKSIVVTFPNLKELILERNGIMKEIWRGQFRAECHEVKGRIAFTLLKCLKLSDLPTLASFCSGDQIFEFPTLEKMIVRECPKMKIFCQGDLSTSQLQKVKLSEFEDEEKGWWEGDLNNTIKRMFEEKVGYCNLRLSDTSELMEIWSRNPQEILSFKYLEKLEVSDCSTLRCLFTLSMALSLPQLREMEVKSCTEMEHIIIEEGPHKQVSNKIVFPVLRSIALKSCADLASFYQGSKMLEFPSLERVKVVGCSQMFAFASAFSREQRREMIDDGGNTTRLSKGIADAVFFDNMVAFPSLYYLVMEGMGELRKIWDDKVTMNSFCNLQYLMVKDCERLSNIFPLNMVERLQKLNQLNIVNCDSLEEIIEPQGLKSNESHAATVTELRLSELPELTHLSKEEIPLGEVIFQLEILKVLRCGKLKSLVPSSVSFKKLILLEVSKCHSLMNLVTLSVAKSMVLLEQMSITDCQMLEEIIAFTSDEVMDGIIFSQLWYLELGGLPSLSRFCSGNYSLGFPSLENVITRQCPKMEIFSKGELSAPKLQEIKSTEGEYVGLWEGNLNTTIQQLFKEKGIVGAMPNKAYQAFQARPSTREGMVVALFWDTL
ncbi:NB-ARC domain-containing disease resistance protein, putative [Theobroma cacao]|uniref:NB-ARC domain-containing disease resistance protein, putative n=1 Tax=Theobroma cacao TaxID=3641 RepID=A0A061F9S5_THECC|nr:NB-ARC domain-containing disease resistance protein, putative [Theobroma cacao]